MALNFVKVIFENRSSRWGLLLLALTTVVVDSTWLINLGYFSLLLWFISIPMVFAGFVLLAQGLVPVFIESWREKMLAINPLVAAIFLLVSSAFLWKNIQPRYVGHYGHRASEDPRHHSTIISYGWPFSIYTVRSGITYAEREPFVSVRSGITFPQRNPDWSDDGFHWLYFLFFLFNLANGVVAFFVLAFACQRLACPPKS